MASSTNELRVFVASPGDCDVERALVREIADAVTQSVGPLVGVRLRVDGWEAVSPNVGRPQALINPLVDECDLFVGFLSTRWGTPTGTHDSGFQEEFERAIDRRASGTEPQVAMFFRDPPGAMLADPGRELRKVLAFKRRLERDRILLYRTFNDEGDLARQLWPLLTQLAVTFTTGRATDAEGTPDGSSATPTAATDLEDADIDDARRQIANAAEGVALLARGERTSIDADRFLLIGLGLCDDRRDVPTHVVNRLFLRREELALSLMEDGIWLRTLASDLGRTGEARESRTVPGWAILGPRIDRVVELLSDGADLVVEGALEILIRARSRPAELWELEGSDGAESGGPVQVWGELFRRPGVARKAEEYLASQANPDDARLIEALLDTDRDGVRDLLAALRGDPTPLLESLGTGYNEPKWKSSYAERLVDVATSESLAGAATRSRAPKSVRVSAASELIKRGSLPGEVLRSFLIDGDLVDQIFEWAERSPAVVSPSDITSEILLLKKEEQNSFDLVHRVVALTSEPKDLVEDFESGNTLAAWDALQWKKDESLVELARRIFDSDAQEVLAPVMNDPSWSDHQELLPFIRAQARRGALRVLLSQDPPKAEDLARLRTEATAVSTYTRDEVLRWMARFAAEQDVDRLLQALETPYGRFLPDVADAIVRVGGANAARRLLESAHASTNAQVAVEAIASDSSTTTDELTALLYSDIDRVRIFAVDALLDRMSTAELKELLDAYPSKKYFYNVICELDWELYGPLSSENPRTPK